MDRTETVLVTGATGYIGGRLVPRLLQEDRRVRVLVRSRAKALSRPWSDRVEIVAGDILCPDTLAQALEGVDIAYYLIHSMSHGANFHDLDIKAARTFGRAASQAGVNRIIYLGGLGDPQANLSPTPALPPGDGEVRWERVASPVTEFRAAVVVGSGSISFEMIRYLAERLPVMICPKWVLLAHPADCRRRLAGVPILGPGHPREWRRHRGRLAGVKITTYKGLLLGYARARGLRRLLIPVPVLTPRLSSYWVHWMTPIPAGITAPLVEGLRNDVIVTNPLARSLFPHIEPRDYAHRHWQRDRRTLRRVELIRAWSDAAGTTSEPESAARLESHQGMIVERRHRIVSATSRRSLPCLHGYRRGARVVLCQLDVATCAACWTACWAAPACAGADDIPITCVSATPWTFGAWKT